MNFSESEKLKTITLKSKSVLYGLNINVTPFLDKDSLEIKVDGTLRIGPKTSNVEGVTRYEVKGGALLLQGVKINIKGFNLVENYRLSECETFFVNASNNEQIHLEPQDTPLYGPIYPLLTLQEMAKKKPENLNVALLVGNKIREINIASKDGKLVFEVDGKSRGTYNPTKKQIQLSPLGIKIKIE